VKHRAVDDADHGYRVVPTPFPLVRPTRDAFTDQKLWYCYAGLWPVVEHVLKEAGCEIDARHVHVAPLPDRRKVRRQGDRPVDNAMLRCVQQQDRAVIRYTPGKVKPAWLITQIARGWPEKTLVVVTTRTNETLDMAQQLRKDGLDATYATRRHYPDEIGPVLVATDGFLSGHTEMQKRHIAIFLDAAKAFSTRSLEVSEYALDARIYGLLADHAKPELFVRDHITALFGFNELHIPEHGQVRRPVHVYSVQVRGGMRFDSANTNAFEVKRAGIWRNNGRNQFIARFCREIDREAAFRPKIRNGPADGQMGSVNPKIAVLVENVDHALALAKLLPEAVMCSGDEVNLDGVPTRDTRHFREIGSKEWNMCISTFAGLAELPEVNVLMRADGGMGVFETCINVNANRPPLIVDICDRHHPLLRQWQRQRHDEYKRLGWNVSGKGPMDPVEAFMNSRPEV